MNRDGFTIIEVMIFVAISAMLLLIAIVGSGDITKRARFTSTVDGVHSTIQRHYEDVVNGVNTRLSIDGCSSQTNVGTDSCLLLGKVLTLNPGNTSLTARYITGKPNAAFDDEGTYDNISRTSDLTVRDQGSENVDLQWGAVAGSFTRESSPLSGEPSGYVGVNRTKIDSIAFIRDPRGVQIAGYYFYSQMSGNLTNSLQTAVSNSAVTSRTSAALCIRNFEDWGSGPSSPYAAIVFGSGIGSSIIEATYQPLITGTARIC